jgi:hypothetical protein
VKKIQGSLNTYISGTIALKDAVMDLQIGIVSINSSALKVAYPPPGIGATQVQKSSVDHHSPAYHASTVALKTGVDLDIGNACKNSAALKLDVRRQELEQIFELVLLEENARMELKSSAKESPRADLLIPV